MRKLVGLGAILAGVLGTTGIASAQGWRGVREVRFVRTAPVEVIRPEIVVRPLIVAEPRFDRFHEIRFRRHC